MKQQTLNTIKSWVHQCKNLFWVSAYDAESSAIFSSHPYVGDQGRASSVHYASEFTLNRIVSLTLGESSRDANVCARYVLDVFESAFLWGLKR